MVIGALAVQGKTAFDRTVRPSWPGTRPGSPVVSLIHSEHGVDMEAVSTPGTGGCHAPDPVNSFGHGGKER